MRSGNLLPVWRRLYRSAVAEVDDSHGSETNPLTEGPSTSRRTR